MIDGYNTLLPRVYCDIERVFISLGRKWIFCLWNISVQSIALKLICLSGQSVNECHQPQNKNKCGLVNRSNITLLLVNNIYSGTAPTEERSEQTLQSTEPQYLHHVPILLTSDLLWRDRLSKDLLLIVWYGCVLSNRTRSVGSLLLPRWWMRLLTLGTLSFWGSLHQNRAGFS